MSDIDRPVAAGRAARHCAQLISRAADPVDFEQEVLRLARRFAEQLGPQLAQLCDVRGLNVAFADAESLPFGDLQARAGSHTVNSFFVLGTERTGVFASVATPELIAVFERLLGGEGTVDPASTGLPRSALQFAARFEQCLLSAIRKASDRDHFAVGAALGPDLVSAPFRDDETVWAITFTAIPPEGQSWTIRLALCRATLSLITASRAASPATGRAIGTRGLDNSAIGDVDFPLRAVLVDTSVSLARLAQLQPGTLIPVALNRSVPLLIEQAVIAHGTAGEVDDRIALEISHTSLPGTR